MEVKTIEDVEEFIKKSLHFEKAMRRVGPDDAKSTLSNLVVIPDSERSVDDILEDKANRVGFTVDDYNDWYECTIKILPSLDEIDRKIVILRLKNKNHPVNWKKISYILADDRITERELSVRTLQRYYKEALEYLLRRFF